MRTNLQNFASTQFRMLSDDQIEQIFMGALELLESTGTRVYSPEAISLLAGAKALVDGDMVRIPAGIVKEALSTIPPRIVLANRDGKRTMVLESDRIHYGTGSDCPFILDEATGQRRFFTKKDVEDAAKIVDACENLDFHMSLGLTSDVPTHSYDRHQAAAMLRNTIKPCVFTALSTEGLSDILDMYYLIRGCREEFEANPGFVVYLEPTTPLLHSKVSMDKIIFSADRRIPAIYTPCPIAGATSPVTLAGMLTVATAEFLVGAVVSQLKRKGAPIIMGGVLSSMDMQSTILTYGSPELHISCAALTDIGRWLKVPVFSTAGCSDSKIVDEQAAAEAALSIMAAGLSGASLIHDVGFLESALIGSHEMVVLSNEIIGMVKHFLRGVKVTDETLALDIMKEVRPGGNFLAHDHTATHFKNEIWFPKLMDRQKYDIWQAKGSQTLGDRVRKQVRTILETHTVPALPPEINKGIDKIIAKADKKANASQTDLV